MTDPTPDFDTVAPNLDQEMNAGIQTPPATAWTTLRKLGPGLIIAASIVGSGELIATTKTGAQAGLTLLWLVVLGCIVKVFVQVELGRYSITHGQTTLNALNQLPGLIGPVNYILWFFIVMLSSSTFQQGGIVGGVGQSLAIACPLTGDYLKAIQVPSNKELEWFEEWERDLSGPREQLLKLSEHEQRRKMLQYERLREQIKNAGELGQQALDQVKSGEEYRDPWTLDDRIWAGIMTAITIALLYSGRYGIIQSISTVLVVGFTLTTIANAIALQGTEKWSLSRLELMHGLAFRLPEGEGGWTSLSTALSAFGIIGVGAMELLVYPYWCIEKGYARFTGKRTDDDAWLQRARGWLRVMHWDAFLSLVVYTLATVAFYLMGATVLYREGRDPEGLRMVATLASAYVPIFGVYAKWLFLLGAIAVLYSTFLVANAGHARLFVDFLKVAGWVKRNDQNVHNRWVSGLCVALPLLSYVLFAIGSDPVFAVLLAGFTQSIMLPLIGLGALYFRWTATDPRLKPTPIWDVALVISFIAFVITGAWGLVSQIMDLIGSSA